MSNQPLNPNDINNPLMGNEQGNNPNYQNFPQQPPPNQYQPHQNPQQNYPSNPNQQPQYPPQQNYPSDPNQQPQYPPQVQNYPSNQYQQAQQPKPYDQFDNSNQQAYTPQGDMTQASQNQESRVPDDQFGQWNHDIGPSYDNFAQYVPNEQEWNGQMKMMNYNDIWNPNNFSCYDYGNFDGPVNSQGQREGYGTAIYRDGSQYQGNWVANKKQGQGVLTKPGNYRFEGQFHEDQRNGPGIEILPNGDKIETTWEQDRKHGQGRVTESNGSQYSADWNWDLMIPQADQGGSCEDCWFLSFFCFILMIVFLVLGIIATTDFFIGFGIVYAILIFEPCCSKTNKYTKHIESVSDIRKVLSHAITSPPAIRWTIQNYHYETRWRTVTETVDGKSRTRTESYQERINTHYADKSFKFRAWSDLSPPEYAMDYIKNFFLTRLRMIKTLELSSTAECSRQHQKYKFLRHHIRDYHYDFHEHRDIPGALEFTLMYNDEMGERPWFARQTAFWWMSLIGLGWIMRIKFFKNSKKVEYYCRKYIHE